MRGRSESDGEMLDALPMAKGWLEGAARWPRSTSMEDAMSDWRKMMGLVGELGRGAAEKG
jgi:hypothetical protein